MLINIDTGKVVDRVPGRQEFDVLRGRLSEAEFDAMVGRINELIDEAGSEIATAGWLPGSDWRGTPFQPIYDKAARGDFTRSAMFFGQLVWYAVMNRPERTVCPVRVTSRTSTTPREVVTSSRRPARVATIWKVWTPLPASTTASIRSPFMGER